MSGIIFQIKNDGLSVNKKIFNNMFSVLKHRGEDCSNTEYLNNVAFGCHHFWTTPEDIGVKLPLISKNKNYYILLDGRIDNRGELIKNLSLEKKGCFISDAELILTAYDEWKEAGFKKLIGSFAFIIYSSNSNSVIAVRDQVGDRTLYFYKNSKMFIIASEPFSLLAHPDIPKFLNESKVAEYFALKDPTDNSSYFKNIYELLPSQYVVVQDNKLYYRRYWNFNLAEKIRHKSDIEYSEHFLELFEKSVSSKLRTMKTPGVMMSGGLDSTSIAAVATKYSGERIKTFSYIFKKYKESDESGYIDYFCNMYDVDSFRINGDEYIPLFDPNSTCVTPNFPEQDAYQALKNKLYDVILKSDTRTLLTGWYGDQLFVGAEYWVKDYIKDLKLIKSFKALRSLSAESGWLNLRKNNAVRIALRPFRPIKNIFFKNKTVYDKYYYLTPFSKSLLSEKDFWDNDLAKGERFGQILNVLGLGTAFDASCCLHNSPGVKIDFRYPFRDIRLIDFFLKLPAYQLFENSGYKNKYILRSSMKELLPHEILHRKDITGFTSLLKSTYDIAKDRMNSRIEQQYDEIKKYIDSEVLNVIIKKEIKELDDYEFLIHWKAFTFIEWKSNTFG